MGANSRKIAEVYYLEGKTAANREALQEALACYHDAPLYFETQTKAAACQVRTGIAKTPDYNGRNRSGDQNPIRL